MMRRSPALQPLSREHHQALYVALLLRRAGDDDTTTAAVARFAEFWRDHGETHFAAEEHQLLGALPSEGAWAAMCDRVRREHAEMIRMATALLADAAPAPAAARALGERLHAHVRFEERELFPALEARLTESELAALVS